MSKYKVCVYAICKNEEKFVKQWVASMSEADEIVVLDTGSTDNTVEELTNLGVKVYQKIFVPWRFDHARNCSLDLVDKNADICVCTDLDERFEKGWREKLENAWQPDTRRARYRYTWNFNDDGSEGCVFWLDKIHSRKGFVWENPVHEVLAYQDSTPCNTVFAEGIQLNHYADVTKSRAQYLPLLELAVNENPHNDRNVHYLGREYMFRGMWDKCIETLTHHLSMPEAVWKDERCASMRFIARAYNAKGDRQSAKCWYYKAVAEAPYLREPHVELALILYDDENWYGVLYFINQALQISERPKTYINDASAWGSQPYDLASLGYYYTGDYDNALKAVEKAIELSPRDTRLADNKKIIINKLNAKKGNKKEQVV